MTRPVFPFPLEERARFCLGKLLLIFIPALMILWAYAAQAALTFDIQPDQDVDGLDLFLFKKGYFSAYTDLAGFAADFGGSQAGQGFYAVKTFWISSHTDDAEENKASGRVDVTSPDLELAYDQGLARDQVVGLRYANIDIPKGAHIKSAYLRFFTNNDNSSGSVNLMISGQAGDHSDTFAAVNNNISSRSKTKNKVAWSPPNWSEPWVSKDLQKSSNLRNVIHEILSRPGFTPGNAISLFIEGTGTNMRNSYSYDYYLSHPDRKRYARLLIEYAMPEPPCNFSPVVLNPGNGVFLPDYSYAGYQWGEGEIPHLTSADADVTYVDVCSFGATADDESDDTQAVLAAVDAYAATPGTVLLDFPAGRFILSDVITITRSGFVLQGEGSGANGTVFQVDIPLSNPNVTKSPDIQGLESEYNAGGWPREENGALYSLYSWMGGFFYTRYNGDRFAKERIADVAEGVRGAKSFTIANPERPIMPLEVISIEWSNPPDDAFLHYLVGNEPVTIGSGVSGPDAHLVIQNVTVTAVNGSTIHIREPLLHDVGLSGQTWTARIRTSHFLKQVGFENFRVVFPAQAVYAGHHLEAGYNALYLTDLQHSWVRNVSVQNADSAVLIDYGKNITLENIQTSCRNFRDAHYDVSIGRSYGVLVRSFDFHARAIHTPSFNSAGTLSVFTAGYIDVGAFDQHMGLNHQNLFDNIIVGYSPNLFEHGGSSVNLPTAAQYNTFWNITIRELPYDNSAGTCGDAPGARIVGLHSPGNILTVNYSPNPYLEGLNGCPAVSSLLDYQLQARLVE